jgi:hypothetical protein
MNNDKNSHQSTPSGTTAHPEQTVPDNNHDETSSGDISYAEWREKYRPIKNPIYPNSKFEGTMFWPNGEGFHFVCSYPLQNIWTLTSMCGYRPIISEGYFPHDVEGFFVTEVPWPHDQSFSIKLDGPNYE